MTFTFSLSKDEQLGKIIEFLKQAREDAPSILPKEPTHEPDIEGSNL
jgi:hypothetical protein